MKLTFFRTTQNEISKSQQRAWINSNQVRFDSDPLRYCDSEVKRTSQISFGNTSVRHDGCDLLSGAEAVCEINYYNTKQIKEELHANTLTNLRTVEKEFRCVCETEFDYLIN